MSKALYGIESLRFYDESEIELRENDGSLRLVIDRLIEIHNARK